MKNQTTMQGAQSLDGLLIARKMAQFCPTSVSLADFKHIKKSPYVKKHSTDNFHPPKPRIEIIKDSSVPETPLKTTRFSFLFEDSKVNNSKSSPNTIVPKSTESLKLDYQLPNIELIKTPNRKPGRPLLVVSLSKDTINNYKKKEISHEPPSNTTKMFDGIAKQVVSDGESYDSE